MLKIEYQEHGYKAARLHASLIYKGKDADIPIEITEIRTEPQGLLRFEQDTQKTTDKLAVFYFHPAQDLLKDNKKFWEEVGSLTRPIRVTVRAKPLRGYAKPQLKVIEGHTEIEMRPPAPELHWYDMRSRPPARDPSCIHLRADGDDRFQLRVECRMWLPESRSFEYDEKAVEFSHFTGPQFYQDVFGPSPDSRPWVVAQPNSNDNREYSWWESKSVLPVEAHPDLALPVRDTIRVRVWPRHSILGREPNRVDARPGANWFAQTYVTVQLDPELVKAEIIEPKEPIPADGQPHMIELEIRRRSDGSLFKNGELSFKLETAGDPPGGTLKPELVRVTEADNGRVRLEYTPRVLKYRPGRPFAQPLHVSVGTGDKAIRADTVKMHLNPALQVKIDAEKCGFDWPAPYERSFPAGTTPCQINGHIGADFNESLSGKQCRRSVGDARPVITAIDENGEHPLTVTERTTPSPENQRGTFLWRLPELEEGMRSLPENRRVVRLIPFQEGPTGEFDADSKAVLAAYRAVLDSPDGQPRFRLPDSGRYLIDSVIQERLTGRGLEMAQHLADRMESDCQKARNGTTLTDAALFGTILVDDLHRQLFDDGINLLSKLCWDLVDYLIKAYKFGEKVLKALPNAPGWLGGWIRRFIEAVKNNPYLPGVGKALEALEYIAGRLAQGATNIGSMLKGYWDGFLLECAKQIENWCEWVTRKAFADALGKVWPKAVEKAVKALGKIFTGAASGQIAEMSGPQALAELIRLDVGDALGLGIGATEALGSVTHSVSVLSFPHADKQSCGWAAAAYLRGVVDLSEARDTMLSDFKDVDDKLKFLSNTLDNLFILAVVAAICTGGLTAPAFTVLSSAGWGKIFVNALVHVCQVANLWVVVSSVDEKYLQLSRELTR